MPFALFVLLLAVLLSYLRGGRLHRIADAPLHGSGLLLVGIALQSAIDVAPAGALQAGVTTVLLLAGQVLVVAWLVLNRHLPGVTLIGIGFALNALVIAGNGAMPVDPAALAALGVEAVALPSGGHVLMHPGTRLPLLADLWAVPLLRSVISAGDVVLAAGLIPLVHALLTDGSRPPRADPDRNAGSVSRPRPG